MVITVLKENNSFKVKGSGFEFKNVGVCSDVTLCVELVCILMPLKA